MKKALARKHLTCSNLHVGRLFCFSISSWVCVRKSLVFKKQNDPLIYGYVLSGTLWMAVYKTDAERKKERKKKRYWFLSLCVKMTLLLEAGVIMRYCHRESCFSVSVLQPYSVCFMLCYWWLKLVGSCVGLWPHLANGICCPDTLVCM